MHRHPKLKVVVYFILILVSTIGLSSIMSQIVGGKAEQPQKRKELKLDKGMTVAQFGQANALSASFLKESFNLAQESDFAKKVDEFGTSEQITSLITKKLALAAEHASKKWIKILIKFGLWFTFLSALFKFFKTRAVSSGVRNCLLVIATVTFGVVLGSDPGPMGTVKDAIYLYGTAHTIFPPRMIALSVFLLIVLLANKYICAWGCQAGTLQELIFRINQNSEQKAIVGRRIKLPFALTNTIRILFLCMFTIAVFAWGIDLIGPIDPFKIYNPTHLGLFGGAFIGILLSASLFIYRPWCHLFCPFGLLGWLVEKASINKISVNYETCIACQQCATACPTAVMGAILKRDKKTIPDCFACYTCRDVCPTGSICFSTRKRAVPPADHFIKRG
ncbi:MAG: 4Fe-4S binding protein [Desulfuromonadaceae bacterium]|nr:4Fe-4S binding protein [Desulfuromonadaceae bacterium]